MMREHRAGSAVLVLVALAALAWWFVPPGFGRGVVTGFVASLGALLLVLYLFARKMRGAVETSLEAPPIPTGSWDRDLVVTAPDGRELDFADTAGRVVVLNFWATWCAPCVAEMPSLRGLMEATADLDVELACVTREDEATVRRFAEKRDPGVPIYLLEGEPPDVFRGRAIPATFVIDRHGGVALRHFGAARWDDEKVVNFIRGLAASP